MNKTFRTIFNKSLNLMCQK
ncbi:hypothetical protein HP552_05925 [Paenibacillus xylanilyticus]|uniref:Uncharacterized protein n=1 Tax=Paenibacillus xylanilyticus TaxID=248903 RepID=A0A7Y6BVA3_9BACL|nr:hypothetical protein [Paenibacillus xylanilyticus]